MLVDDCADLDGRNGETMAKLLCEIQQQRDHGIMQNRIPTTRQAIAVRSTKFIMIMMKWIVVLKISSCGGSSRLVLHLQMYETVVDVTSNIWYAS